MTHKIALGGIFVAALTVVAMALPTYAQSSNSSGSEGNSESTQSKISEARCTTAQAKLEVRAQEMEAIQTSRTNIYSGILDKTNAIITNAKAAGYDTAAIVAAQAEVQTQYQAFVTAMNNYTESLNTAKDSACNEDATQYSNSLSQSRSNIAAVRNASANLRNAIVNTLLPSFNEYAGWLRTTQATEEQTDDTTTTDTDETSSEGADDQYDDVSTTNDDNSNDNNESTETSDNESDSNESTSRQTDRTNESNTTELENR